MGGDGFVGSGFVDYFKDIGLPYQIISRLNYSQYVGTECDVFINANGNSKKFLASEDPKAEFQSSVASVRNSLVDFKFKKYIFLSTGDIYPDTSLPKYTLETCGPNPKEQSSYGFHKYLAELCVQHCAENWLIIRMGGFVGRGLKKNAVYDVLYGDKLWVHESSRFQYINTYDSAALVIELVRKNISNQIFNLTGTGTISVAEIMKLSGRNIVCQPNAKIVISEISTKKIEGILTLPSTYDVIYKFLTSLKN